MTDKDLYQKIAEWNRYRARLVLSGEEVSNAMSLADEIIRELQAVEKLPNSDDIVDLVLGECDNAGGPYAWAKEHKIKNIYMVLRGERLPGKDILAALGYRVVRRYMRIAKKK